MTTSRPILAHILIAFGFVLAMAEAPCPVQARDRRADACCMPTGADFPKVGGNFGNQNYSSLDALGAKNISRLGAAWRNDLEGGSTAEQQQASLVELAGVIYVETTQGDVFAVNGKTGQTNWSYKPGYGTSIRRGVAVGAGNVYTSMNGHRVIALSQSDGKPVWERVLNDEGVTGTMRGAVTYFDGLVYVGNSNSSRGVVLALDAATGATVWKFFATPSAGEFGSDTWEGDSWKNGHGSPWMHPAVDPELGLIYWTFGNAGGTTDGAQRAGQNLFANSIVALNAKTGRRIWHFQSVHHDLWDIDNVMAPVLAELKINGRLRKAVIYGSKTGMYFVLDRATGVPLTPVDERPVPQDPSQKTWPTQPYARGEPLVPLCPPASGIGQPPPYYEVGCLFQPHGQKPVATQPGAAGGTDWSPISYSPRTGLVYVGAGILNQAYSLPDGGIGFRPLGQSRGGKLIAYDPATHKIVWQKTMVWALAHGHGVLSTAADILFIGQPDGQLLAFSAKDGRELWSFQTGAGVNTTPITYEIDGEQYVAVFAGGNVLLYNSQQGDHLWAFKLDGKVPPLPAPPPLSVRQPIDAPAVEGSDAANTVTLGRNWTNGAVAPAETTRQNSMAPQHMRVPVGTAVTFVNPRDNVMNHCATQFYEGLFNTGPLAPGAIFIYTFSQPGEYFYNDCASPRTTGKIVVY